MFKKFVKEEDVHGQNQVKSSAVRGIRNSLTQTFPGIEGKLDEILPKKQPILIYKCQNHINLIVVNTEIVFFNERDGPYFPTLRLLHKYPDILPKVQVDRGAIKFVMSGANIMCPGLTSKGGKLPEVDMPKDSIVAVMAEGKQHALAVGRFAMSFSEIREKNKDIGIDNIHYLNDGLWKIPNL